MVQEPDTADIYLCILVSSGDIVSFCIHDPAGFSSKTSDPAFLPIQFHTVEQACGNECFLSAASFREGHGLCVLAVPCGFPVRNLTVFQSYLICHFFSKKFEQKQTFLFFLKNPGKRPD